ncbi:MAG: Metallophosphoesterase family protein [Candidatus Hydrogenedentes bacterium]|nr:Metallophosphoesterase family protein [Candidatus Hydrogenedentota bacterium]
MLIAIIADPHANIEALTAVMKEIDARRPGQIYCLGDLTGYNASLNEVVDLIRQRNIASIMGNHDAAVCGLEDPWFFRSAAQAAVAWQRDQLRADNREWLARAPEQITVGNTVLAVHGAPASRDEYIVDWLGAMQQLQFLNGRGIQICFFGHSHRASFFSERGNTSDAVPQPGVIKLQPGNRYFINPGAVGQPRDHDPRAAFGLFDSDNMTFEFCRVEYDIDRCMDRIIDADLPKELARRLRKGK